MTDSKTALVTGGATGIGSSVVRQLRTQGLQVAVCDVNEVAGQALADDTGAVFIPCNVMDYDSVTGAVAQCETQLGVPDYVHLNAGIMTVPTNDAFLPIEEVSQEQFARIMGVNFNGVFHGVKCLIPKMRTNGGAITITASTAGLSVLPVDPLYAASKHALIGFGRAIAAANADSNLRINVICPGVVDTQIVPDAFRAPQFNMMSTDMLATEVVDLLLQGANGEVRVKNNPDREAFAIEPPDLST